ncbi:NAD(P)-dependent oxidoreductase [Stutzerimonas azotifigens]|uniref:NAD(P)-dependent oxidoreductase n=1 Tax=Stutzerimonas azotifigens TaxID=291995 RepID=UPI0004082EED|nr:NAD(P)-dependent oxidoreductase [Stutzerimonas azotifigens]
MRVGFIGPGIMGQPIALNLARACVPLIVLITLVTGFVGAHRLDPDRLRAILDAGPMARRMSRAKGLKLAIRDLEAQAAITDVLKNSRLVAEAAAGTGLARPLMGVCLSLFNEAVSPGFGHADMIAVIKATEARSDAAARHEEGGTP